MSAYVPPPLPPSPKLSISDALLHRLSEADRAIGRLDGVITLLPDKSLFLHMYVRKEAVLSCQIEGTQATLDELLRYENRVLSGKPVDEIATVSKDAEAMMYGLARLRDPDGSPPYLRLLREMHARLLNRGRGDSQHASEFRRSQSWLGGAKPAYTQFVPPPVKEMEACLNDLERFLQDDALLMPPLVKAGLIHVQFETIHPFLEGNGRLGRLLISLFLVSENVLREPLLYLSLYLNAHRDTYYRLLQDVRLKGDWEAWLEFFLQGVAETANNAYERAMRMVALFRNDREKIAAAKDQSNSMLRLHEIMQDHPFLNAAQAQRQAGVSAPTVNKALEGLIALGIVREITGKRRNRVFAYPAFLRILDEETQVATAP